MAEELEEAQAQIAQSRAELTATADDLHDRLSPRRMVSRQGQRMGSRFGAIRESVMGAPTGTMERMSHTLEQGSDAAGVGLDKLRQMPDSARGSAQGNPLAAGLVAFGAGLLMASMVPVSRTEREAAPSVAQSLGPAVDHIQSAAKEVGSDVKDDAKEAAQHVQTVGTKATQNVADHGRSAAREVADDGRSAVQQHGD